MERCEPTNTEHFPKSVMQPSRPILTICALPVLAVALTLSAAPTPADGPARIPLLTDREAWQCLPDAEVGTGQPLPAWARALASPLPRTTAAMLELDFVHRTQSPLGQPLRAKMRWVAAKANDSPYGAACALADLRRAAVAEADIRRFSAGDWSNLPDAEVAALKFTRKLTVAGATVTDGEVAELRRIFGDGAVAALVLHTAYANFQDRLLLTLGIAVEEGGPLPPLHVRFRKPPAGGATAAVRPAPNEEPFIGGSLRPPGADWQTAEFGTLQGAMAAQKVRPGRIPVPSYSAYLQALPPGATPPAAPMRIRWSLVCMGYQPQLAAGWNACTRTFGQEAKQDRAFEESLFWVVTRSIDCFY
jgi:hypothetical protein